MGVTNNSIITAPVSIADVESVIGTANHDVGSLCASIYNNSKILWIRLNNNVVSDMFKTSVNPQVGETFTLIGSSMTGTVLSVNSNGTLHYKINTQGEPTYDTSILTPKINNTYVTIPFCFLFPASLNIYSIYKPLREKGQPEVLNTTNALIESLNCGFYLNPINKASTTISKIKDLITDTTENSKNFNFYYIFFPKVFLNSTFRLTDFNNYNHTQTFPTFYILDGTSENIMYNWYSGDGLPDEVTSPSDISFNIPIRASNASYFDKIKYAMQFTGTAEQYGLSAAIIVYEISEETSSTCTDGKYDVFYGNIVSGEEGSIHCELPTSGKSMNNSQFYNNQTMFKWIFTLGVNTGGLINKYILPLKGVNIGGTITGRKLERGSSLSGTGMIYYIPNDVSNTYTFNLEFSTIYGKMYTDDAPELTKPFVYLIGSDNYNNVNCIFWGYYNKTANSIESFDGTIIINNADGVGVSKTVTIPRRYVTLFFTLNYTNYTGSTTRTKSFSVALFEKNTSSNTYFKLGNTKKYTFQTQANSNNNFIITLSNDTSNQKVTRVRNVNSIVDNSTSTVGYSNSPTFSDNTQYPKYDIIYARNNFYRNHNMDNREFYFAYRYGDYDITNIDNNVKVTKLCFSTNPVPVDNYIE